MRVSVGSLRSNAYGSRLRAGPHSCDGGPKQKQQKDTLPLMESFYQTQLQANSPLRAELPSLAYVYGGGSKRKQQENAMPENAMPSQYRWLMDSFC